MIYVMKRDYSQVLTALDYEPYALEHPVIYDDLMLESLEAGASTYRFKILKQPHADKVSLVEVGTVLVVNGLTRVDEHNVVHENQVRYFEVIRTEEDEDSKEVFAEDIGLDLLNEVVAPVHPDGAKYLSWYFEKAAADSGWVLAGDESEQATRTLIFEHPDNAMKRLRAIAKAFDLELEFYCGYDYVPNTKKIYDGEPDFLYEFRRLVYFKKQRGRKLRDNLTLSSVNITSVRKTADISELATAIVPYNLQEGISLNGYTYDDGRYWVWGEMLCDRESGKKWGRHSRDSFGKYGYIAKYFISESKDQQRLFAEALEMLKRLNEPVIEYEVENDHLPRYLAVGDMLTLYDPDFTPAINVTVRVAELRYSLTDPNHRVAKLTTHLNRLNTSELKGSENVKTKPLDRKTLETRNGWQQPTDHNGLRCEKDALGYIHLNGYLNAPSGIFYPGTDIAILPSGYRPSKPMYLSAVTAHAVVRITINTSGAIRCSEQLHNHGWMSFDNISFKSS